jgi:hypothetical protein
MEPLEPTSVEDLVRRYTPELIPQSDRAIRLVVSGVFFVLTWTVTVIALGAIGVHDSAATLASACLAGGAAGVGIEWQARRNHKAQVERFSNTLQNSPWVFYEAVALKFVEEIERQRARTLGPDSDWGRARLKLERAAHEADRSVAYWTQRLAMEPDGIAQAQLVAATRLWAKFHTALTGLDQRARLLVAFFNDCEARIAVLQSTKRDYEEIRKLEALADRSDEIVTNAEATLASIGAGFLSEALRVANALGGLERIGIANLAGEVSVDHLEALADRIVESAEREQRALERVTESI